MIYLYYSKTDGDGMSMCCEKKTLIGRRNVWNMRPRGRPKRTWRKVVQKDCQARNMNRECYGLW